MHETSLYKQFYLLENATLTLASAVVYERIYNNAEIQGYGELRVFALRVGRAASVLISLIKYDFFNILIK